MRAETVLPLMTRINGTGCDSTLVGGKSTGLDRLASHGMPIPTTYALTVAAFRSFVREHDLAAWLVALEASAIPDPAILETEAARIEAKFLEGPLPEALRNAIVEVAEPMLSIGPIVVRSSATAEDLTTASFAGQYRSFVGVDDIEEVETAVRRCWASLWLPPARAYRKRHGIEGSRLEMAVILQQMVNADWSGVAFTRDPKGSPNAMRIEMVPGLGETLASGSVTPHDFVVRRSDLEIRDRTTTAPPFLEDLTRMLLRLEHLLGEPQDVEWAYANGDLTLLQSRSITVPGPLTALDDGFDRPIGSSDRYTPRGVVEMLPGVLPPLLWTINAPMLENALRDVLAAHGVTIVEGDRPIVGRFAGRAALNLSALEEASSQLPGGSAASVEAQFLDGDTRPASDGPARRSRGSWFAAAKARRFRAHVQDEVDIVAAATEGILDLEIDLTTLTARSLLAYRHALRDLAWRTYSAEAAASSAATSSFTSLVSLLGRWLDDDDASEWAQRLTAGELSRHATGVVRMNQLNTVFEQYRTIIPNLGSSLVAGPRSRLRERIEGLGSEGLRFLADVDRIVRRQGSRAIYAGATWEEDPRGVWDQLAMHAEGVGAANPPDGRTDAHDALMASIRGSRHWTVMRVLTGQLTDIRERWIRRQTDETTHLLGLREHAKATLLALGGEERRVIREGADRLLRSHQIIAVEDVLLLSDEEFREMVMGRPGPPESILHRRMAVLQHCRERGSLPAAFTGSPDSDRAPTASDSSVLKGWAASAGVVEGRAHIIDAIESASTVHRGDILVAHSTDASWTPLMLLVAGLVLEEGGPLSHGAIVAREFGIPAVLNVAGATVVLEDGERIVVDGFSGEVRRMSDDREQEATST
jgi:pyruvate,water dikinase